MRRSKTAHGGRPGQDRGDRSPLWATGMFCSAALLAVAPVTAGAALGRDLYAERCASCHGAELEGQPDWKRRLPSGRMPAPPHDASGHTWHHADDALIRITRDGIEAVIGGGYQSDMPAFGDVLSDDEIRAILAFIKTTWPERERGFQAEVTRGSLEASQ
jgi:mono/diheme cytochrome c family protein